MNKGYKGLILASLAALLATGAGTIWLLWHSWEESLRLERQNRELMATLEASRIRLENFCEYPAEALCPVDTAGSTPIPSGMDILQVMPPVVPSAEASVSTQASPATSLSPEAHAGAEQTQAAVPLRMTPPSPVPQASSPLQPAEVPEAVDIVPAPSLPPEQASPAPAPLQESNDAAHTAEPPRETPDKEVKKTWSNIDYKGRALLLNLSGEGETLIAREGETSAERYEVLLQGRYGIRNYFPDHPIVASIRGEVRDRETALVFTLKRAPSSTAVRNIDARTIVVDIR